MNEKLLENRQLPDMILGLMKALNLVILSYITLISIDCLRGIIWEKEALNFIREIRRLPIEYWKIPVITVGCYMSLLLLLSVNESADWKFIGKTFLECLLAFAVCYGIHFGYMGIFLLVLADVMQHTSRFRGKMFAVALVTLIYICMDYELLSAWFPMVSFEDFLTYYNARTQLILTGVRNVFTSLNLLLFILYMIVAALMQLGEKERILKLNTRLNQVNDELREANRKLEEYARESVIAAQTRERNRLAREIHDTLGHSLTGIISGIEACLVIMDLAPEATKEQLKAIAEVARSGITDVRRSVNALRPDALEHMDLNKALEQMIDEMRRSTGVDIRFDCGTQLTGLNQDEEDIVYRIVQESITNAIRHGKAKEVDIHISREYFLLKIHIKDNGIGCENVKKGFGLHHMQERLDLLGGKIAYDGSDGFVIDAEIPIRWGTEE